MSGFPEAFGFAAGIIQFIDFAVKLIHTAARINESASGTTQESDDFDAAEKNLEDARAQISNPSDAVDDKKVLEICDECKVICDDLRERYNKLKVSPNEKGHVGRKVRSLYTAAKGVWGSSYINTQKDRLNALRSDLLIHLVTNNRSISLQLLQMFPGLQRDLHDQHKILLKLEANANNSEASVQKIHTDITSLEGMLRDVKLQTGALLEKDKSAAKEQIFREKLSCAKEAIFDKYESRYQNVCLEGTRTAVLSKIEKWVEGDSEECIFWLNGLAGTGKSTITRTIAQKYKSQDRLAATYFFSRDSGGDSRKIAKLVTSLALQLTKLSKALELLIGDVISENSDIDRESLSVQWRQLIIEPLTKLKAIPQNGSLLILLDALDECDDFRDICLLISLLLDLRKIKTVRVKAFVTSRGESYIKREFRKKIESMYQSLSLDDLPKDDVDKDIKKLYYLRFSEFQQEINDDSEDDSEDDCEPPTRWPSDGQIEILTQRASQLFIWADTACRYVRGGGRLFAETRMSKLTGDDFQTTSPEEGLDFLYSTVLQESISKDADLNAEEVNFYCSLQQKILSTVVTSFSALSVRDVSRVVMQKENEVKKYLKSLLAIFYVPEKSRDPIVIHHPSFRDFLTSSDRCKDRRFAVDQQEAHSVFANTCLKVMSRELKEDLCNLCEPGIYREQIPVDHIERNVSELLCYACRYWVEHLKSTERFLDGSGKVLALLKQHLTHWLEALSLLGEVSQSVAALVDLQRIFKQSRNSEISSFLKGVYDFVRKNIQIIARAPLQVYYAAFVFTPKSSVVYKRYEMNARHGIRLLTESKRDEALLQVLEDGGGDSLVFSPNGKIIAMNRYDELVTWDSATGKKSVLSFSSQSVSRADKSDLLLIFSPDSALIALEHYSFLNYRRAQVVSIVMSSSRCVERSIYTITEKVTCGAFTEDSKYFAYTLSDGTIKISDTIQGIVVEVIEPQQKVDKSPSLSWMEDAIWTNFKKYELPSRIPDHQITIDDQKSVDCVTLTNLETGIVVTWDVPGMFVNTTLSSDGRYLATTSPRQVINLWDVDAIFATREGSAELRQSDDYLAMKHIRSVPKRGSFAFASSRGRIGICDMTTGQRDLIVKNSYCSVESLVCSPCGKYLIASTKRIVPAPSFKKLGVFLADNGAELASVSTNGIVQNMMVSGDSKYLMTYMESDNQVVFDLRDALTLKEVCGYHDWASDQFRGSAIAMSTNSKLSATAFQCDKKIQIWALTEYGTSSIDGKISHIDLDSGTVDSIALSGDAQVLACVARYNRADGPVLLWDTASRKLLYVIRNTEHVLSVAFSPGDIYLALALKIGEVKMWSLAESKIVGEHGCKKALGQISFAADGGFLETDSGRLRLNSLFPNLFPNTFVPEEEGIFFMEDDWIQKDAKRLLWLPPAHRGIIFKVIGRSVAIYNVLSDVFTVLHFGA